MEDMPFLCRISLPWLWDYANGADYYLCLGEGPATTTPCPVSDMQHWCPWLHVRHVDSLALFFLLTAGYIGFYETTMLHL